MRPLQTLFSVLSFEAEPATVSFSRQGLKAPQARRSKRGGLMKLHRHVVLVALALVCALALPAKAHETDQYTFPLNRQFADLGPYLTAYFYDAIDRGVTKTNDRIRVAVHSGDRKAIEKLHSPEVMAEAVNHEFPVALFFIEGLDKTLTASEA